MGNLLPRLRSRFFEPLIVLKRRSPKLSYWRRLEQTQFLSLEILEEIQQRRFMEMWNFLWRRNAFYRKRFTEHGIEFKSVKSISDIKKLPILTKKEIRANTEEMISTGFKKECLLHFKTGGSTGKALDIFITDACSEQRNACARRHDRWAGWEPGEAIGAVWGNPKITHSFKEKIIDRLVQPYIYFDTMEVTENAVKMFSKEWKRARPTLLFGHAHSLFILAQMVQRLKIEEIQPVGIISTSMMLLPHERRLIEQVFKVKVTDRYGCEEVSLIGCECELHNGMHMNIEHLVVEFIKDDGTGANVGEPGHIVVTDLMNKAMPFIRYNVEDIGVALDRECSCGRRLPLMDKVTGRVADFLIKKDGTRIAGVSLIENTLTKLPGIDQMQILQESIDEIQIKIIPGRIYSEEIRSRLIDYFEQLFGFGTKIKVEEIKEILPEKSGKFRFSICKVE